MYRPFIFILQIQKYYSNDTFVLHCKNSLWMFKLLFGGSDLLWFQFFRILGGVRGFCSFESSATRGTCCTFNLVVAMNFCQLISPCDASGHLELLCNVLEGPLVHPARGGWHLLFLSNKFCSLVPLQKSALFSTMFLQCIPQQKWTRRYIFKHFVASLFSFARVYLNSSFIRYVPSQIK